MNDPLKLAAILLLAGPSSRLGQSKQLVRFEGESLARRAARLLTDVVGDAVIAVTGCEQERVARELDGLAVRQVHNPDWSLGMGGSIACGARQVPDGFDGILVGVCDQWLLSRADLDHLTTFWRAAPDRIHTACWQEGAAHVSGPPVIFPARLRGDLRGLDKARGARQVIDRYIDRVEFIETRSAALDLDRPEDLERLQEGR